MSSAPGVDADATARADKQEAGDMHALAGQVLKLPNEITAEIFQHYLPIYPKCPPLVGDGSPTTLIHVCHQWRTVGLHSRKLWRAILLVLELDAPQDHEVLVEAAKTWLQRSAPLQISLCIRCDVLDASEGHWIAGEALYAERHRWQYADLILSCLLVSLLRPTPAKSAARESLLSSSQINQAVLSSNPPGRSDLFSGLTNLRLDFVSIEDAWPILQNSTQLVWCWISLAILSHPPDVPYPATPVLFRSLQTLVLHCVADFWEVSSYPPSIGPLLDALLLPALKRFAVLDFMLELTAPSQSAILEQNFHRWNCRLQTLVIIQFPAGSRVKQRAERVFVESFPSLAVSGLNFRPDSDYERWLEKNWGFDWRSYAISGCPTNA